MCKTSDLHEYIIQTYIDYYIFNEKMSDVSIRMYFLALHYIDRGEY